MTSPVVKITANRPWQLASGVESQVSPIRAKCNDDNLAEGSFSLIRFEDPLLG